MPIRRRSSSGVAVGLGGRPKGGFDTGPVVGIMPHLSIATPPGRDPETILLP